MQFTLKGTHDETVVFEDIAGQVHGKTNYRMVVTGSDGIRKADIRIDVEDIKRLAKAS